MIDCLCDNRMVNLPGMTELHRKIRAPDKNTVDSGRSDKSFYILIPVFFVLIFQYI